MRAVVSTSTAGLLLAGCFFNPQGSVDATGAAGSDATTRPDSESASEASPSSPTTSEATGSETVGEATLADETVGETAVPGECGDAKIDPGEECDNGANNNGMNGSICRADCHKNVCGDGYVAASESCDDGNDVDDDACSTKCKAAGCGNGQVDPGEECDAGPDNGGGECSALCKLPFCGDGDNGPGEECDEGGDNSDAGACTLACKDAICGDGKLQVGVEQCDDGNNVDGDGCDACMTNCGDGALDPGEECDFGGEGVAEACKDCKRAAYVVFVTSQKFSGELGGLAGADAKCNAAADDAGLPGSYKAWLSDGATDAAERLMHSVRPYIRVDGQMVAKEWIQLLAGSLLVPIDVTEQGQALVNGGISCNNQEGVAWTATNKFGMSLDTDCENWMKAGGGNGVVGSVAATDNTWTNLCSVQCTSFARLYCFEQ